MPLISSQVTVVASTFTALNAACPGGWTKLIVTTSSTTVPCYLGPSGVTAATGFSLPFGSVQTIEVPPSEVLFAHTTANITAYVLRSSLST